MKSAHNCKQISNELKHCYKTPAIMHCNVKQSTNLELKHCYKTPAIMHCNVKQSTNLELKLYSKRYSIQI